MEGERDPAVLARLRDPRIKGEEETIRKSLEGNWRAYIAYICAPAAVIAISQSLQSDRRLRQGDREARSGL